MNFHSLLKLEHVSNISSIRGTYGEYNLHNFRISTQVCHDILSIVTETGIIWNEYYIFRVPSSFYIRVFFLKKNVALGVNKRISSFQPYNRNIVSKATQACGRFTHVLFTTTNHNSETEHRKFRSKKFVAYLMHGICEESLQTSALTRRFVLQTSQ